jgi:hypothetical protein
MKRYYLLVILLVIDCYSVEKASIALSIANAIVNTCTDSKGAEVAYIDCRHGDLSSRLEVRKKFLEELQSENSDPKFSQTVNFLLRDTNSKLSYLDSWKKNSLPSATLRDERWAAEEAKRQAEADRIARIEKIKTKREEMEDRLADMRRTGKKNPSECTSLRDQLENCIQKARMTRQGAEMFGTVTGINTGNLQDMAASAEVTCRSIKTGISIACAFAGEADFLEVQTEIRDLDIQIRNLESRR